MAALVARNFGLSLAEHIVTWYSGRMWTLWLLLLALPFAGLAMGCAALFRVRVPSQPAKFFIAATTLAAAAILAIVILHMAAN